MIHPLSIKLDRESNQIGLSLSMNWALYTGFLTIFAILYSALSYHNGEMNAAVNSALAAFVGLMFFILFIAMAVYHNVVEAMQEMKYG